MNKKCIVIGSNCFTGSHMVDRLLRDKWDVIGVSRSKEKSALYLPYKQHQSENFRFVQIDLNLEMEKLKNLLHEFRPDFVVNVAALSEVNQSNFTPLEYFEINSLSVVKLSQILRNLKSLKRYIHVSSAEIYGPCSKEIDESEPLRPSTPYAVSKATADLFLLTLFRNFKFPVTLVRSTNVYGKHQQLFKIVPRVNIFLKMGRTVHLEGGGDAIKSFIHIRDVIDGVMRIIDYSNPKPIYHFSTNLRLSIREIVEEVCRLSGYDFKKCVQVSPDRVGQDSKYVLNTGLASSDLSWKPSVDFSSGLHEVKSWVDTNWSEISKEPLEYIHKVRAEDFEFEKAA